MAKGRSAQAGRPFCLGTGSPIGVVTPGSTRSRQNSPPPPSPSRPPSQGAMCDRGSGEECATCRHQATPGQARSDNARRSSITRLRVKPGVTIPVCLVTPGLPLSLRAVIPAMSRDGVAKIPHPHPVRHAPRRKPRCVTAGAERSTRHVSITRLRVKPGVTIPACLCHSGLDPESPKCPTQTRSVTHPPTETAPNVGGCSDTGMRECLRRASTAVPGCRPFRGATVRPPSGA
jgi:hypothetical protein